MISVVMPTRNGERTVARAIQSVLAQTLARFELLVVDNGSDDRTPEIVRAFQQSDPRVRLLSEPTAGAAHARNRGLRDARHPIIAVHDDDDVSHPERFAVLLGRLQDDPRLVMVGSWALVFDDDAGMRPPFHHATRDRLIRIQLRHGPCPFVASTVLFRRDAALAAGGYRSEFTHCDDYCLWARLAEHGRLANEPRHLGLYRHQDPSRRPEYARDQTESARALKERYFVPISRFEDLQLRFAMRRLHRRADEQVALDWPPALLERFGLRELMSRRAA